MSTTVEWTPCKSGYTGSLAKCNERKARGRLCRLAGVVRSGRIAGGRAYGYRPIIGKPGELEIEEEADVIRQIFTMYAAGTSPRNIAAALNADSAATRWPSKAGPAASTMPSCRRQVGPPSHGRLGANRSSVIRYRKAYRSDEVCRLASRARVGEGRTSVQMQCRPAAFPK